MKISAENAEFLRNLRICRRNSKLTQIRGGEEVKQGSALRVGNIREEMKGDGVLPLTPTTYPHSLTYSIVINMDMSLKGSTFS